MTQSAEEVLEHFGVPGMRWGIRKALGVGDGEQVSKFGVRTKRNGAIGARATISRGARKDQSWVQNADKVAYTRVYKKAAGKIRKGTRALNKDPRFADKDFRRDSPLRQKYYSEYSKLVTDQLNAAAVFKGRSPKKKFQVRFEFDLNKEATPRVIVQRADTRTDRKAEKAAAREVRRMRHSDDDGLLEEVEFDMTFDENGYILDMQLPEGFSHEDIAEEILAHYGVPGMHWGVSRGGGSGGSSSSTSRVPGKKTVGGGSGGKVVTKKPAAPSSTVPAKPAPKSSGKLEKSGQKTKRPMTDDELKTAISRMQMEKTYKQLKAEQNPQKASAKKVISEILVNTAKNSAQTVLTAAATNAGKMFLSKALMKSSPDLAKSLWSPKANADTSKIAKDITSIVEEALAKP